MTVQRIQSAVTPTPFHSRTSALCRTNEWSRWAGYTTVDCYTDVELEYFACRNAATLFDLSPMIKYRIAGPDAERYLNRLVTRDVRRLGVNRVAYVVWCNDAGKVLDDGTLFRFSESEYRLCAQDRHLGWLLDSAIGYDVRIDDVTDSIAALALQGPTACAVLKRMGLDGIEHLRPFQIRDHEVAGTTLSVSRTGFSGDLGYELWVEPGAAEALWDALLDAGKLSGLRPMGSRALELVRVEAGFILPHVDFMPVDSALRPTRGRSPFELGFDWLVDFDKGHFNGRRALLEEQRTGSRYRLVRMDVQGNKAAEGAFVYHAKSVHAGQVTSAMWSPVCKRNIAIAELKSEYRSRCDDLWVEIYVNKELKWDKLMARCHIVDKPFFNPARRWATPAADF